MIYIKTCMEISCMEALMKLYWKATIKLQCTMTTLTKNHHCQEITPPERLHTLTRDHHTCVTLMEDCHKKLLLLPSYWCLMTPSKDSLFSSYLTVTPCSVWQLQGFRAKCQTSGKKSEGFYSLFIIVIHGRKLVKVSWTDQEYRNEKLRQTSCNWWETWLMQQYQLPFLMKKYPHARPGLARVHLHDTPCSGVHILHGVPSQYSKPNAKVHSSD